MKQLFFLLTIIMASSFTGSLYAQDSVRQNNMPTTLSIGTQGMKLTKDKKWNHIKTPWTTNDPRYAMTRVDSNDYVYTISNIRDFYGVGKDTAIERIALVFRDSTGHKQTGNMYIAVWKKTMKITPPANG